jgi:hypothetical protein
MLTTNLVLETQPLEEIRRTDEAVWITLRDGSVARLDLEHPHFDLLMIYVESELRRSRPVGLVMDPSRRVIDIGAAHDTPVRSVRPLVSDPNRFEVCFWGYSPVCGLTRDQPDFERIHATLTQAAQTGQMVWVAIHSQEVVEGEPDEDGLIPGYPRIMDVRPDSYAGALENAGPRQTAAADGPIPVASRVPVTPAHDLDQQPRRQN